METDPLWFCGGSLEAAAREAAIARDAYFRAQRRGFEPGHELEDWLAAESEFNRLVGGGAKARAPVYPERSSTATDARVACEAMG
jgi:hypothetical protein